MVGMETDSNRPTSIGIHFDEPGVSDLEPNSPNVSVDRLDSQFDDSQCPETPPYDSQYDSYQGSYTIVGVCEDSSETQSDPVKSKSVMPINLPETKSPYTKSKRVEKVPPERECVCAYTFTRSCDVSLLEPPTRRGRPYYGPSPKSGFGGKWFDGFYWVNHDYWGPAFLRFQASSPNILDGSSTNSK